MTSKARHRAYAVMLGTMNQLPMNERYYVVLKLLHTLDPDAIPVTPDGRRMSSEEARRRVALRRDRLNSAPRSAVSSAS
jgi:hypothetical protein